MSEQSSEHNAHSHDHGHDHDHSHVPSSPRRLIAATAVTLTVFFAELIGGLVSGSLALLADAGHMLTDAAGLLMALAALFIGRRKANDSATFGHRRAEVFAALANAISVLVIAGFIVWEAVKRFGAGAEINTQQMLIIATVGLIANLIGMWLLSEPAKGSVNIRGAYLHVLVDAAGSVAVIISALLIAATGWTSVDAVVSLIIAALIVPRSLKLARTCVSILMEHTPDDVDITTIRQALESLDGVVDSHDLHVWSLSGSETLLTVHLVTDGHCHGNCDETTLLDRAQTMLATQFGIEHSTIQIEHVDHVQHEFETHC